MAAAVFKIATVTTLLALASLPAHADLPDPVAIAKMGAKLVGDNYAVFENCQLPAAQLAAYVTKSKVKYAAAGADFDPQFAAGKAESQQFWHSMAAQLGGDDKMRAQTCPNAAKNYQKLMSR